MASPFKLPEKARPWSKKVSALSTFHNAVSSVKDIRIKQKLHKHIKNFSAITKDAAIEDQSEE